MSDNEKKVIVLGPGKKLAYAENRSQNPARLRDIEGDDNPLAMHKFIEVSGEASYITIADGSQIISILCLLADAFRQWYGKVPHIVVAGKHGNPCGAAISWVSREEAVRKALMGDYVAVMGGEIVTNFPIDEILAKELFAPQPEYNIVCYADIGRSNWGLDVIFAPSFDDAAVALLSKKETRRLLANANLLDSKLSLEGTDLRPVIGGYLEQQAPRFVLTKDSILDNEALLEICRYDLNVSSLLIAWAVAWRASSNTVALAKDNMLIGLGCGQQDRIACVRLCIDRATRAGHDTAGSVFASDAFFPYAQGKLPSLIEMEKVVENGPVGEINSPRDFLKMFSEYIKFMTKIDKREGPELLIDAGCIGGVVPFDGKNKEEVKKLFKDAGVAVAFVAPENRGFSKHA